MAWKLAPSIKAMFDEANWLFPNRSKASDGTIGDAAHASRTSDHNPAPDGYVYAGDLTHDPAHGCDAHALFDGVRQRHDSRVKYIISRGRIAGPGTRAGGWNWNPYSGTNQHDKHVHLSVWPHARDDIRPWFTAPATPPPPVGLAAYHFEVSDMAQRSYVAVDPPLNGAGHWSGLLDTVPWGAAIGYLRHGTNEGGVPDYRVGFTPDHDKTRVTVEGPANQAVHFWIVVET